MYIPEIYLPTPGQRETTPQRHTAACTAAPITRVNLNLTIAVNSSCRVLQPDSALPLTPMPIAHSV